MKSLVIAFHQFLFRIRFGQRRQSLLVQSVDRFHSPQRQVESPRRRAGDLTKQSFVQPRIDGVALFIADVIRSALGVFNAQHTSFRRANPNGENLQALLRRFLCSFQSSGILVLAVGEKDQDFVIIAFLESMQRRFDCLGQGRAPLRNNVHVERVHALTKRGIIHGQRALQKRAARKGHQAEAVGLRLLHQIQRGKFCARQPIGSDVFGQHALGGVDGHDDVQPALFDFLPIKTPLRPGQCHDHTNHGQHHQGHANFLSARGNANRQRGKQS